MVTNVPALPWKVAKDMVFKSPVISGQSQVTDGNKTLCTFVKRDNISSVAFVTQTFTPAAANLQSISPIRTDGRRVYIDEKSMDNDKPYLIKYGKGTFIILKEAGDRIHVYRLP